MLGFHFFLTTMSDLVSLLPNEIIIEILLRLPSKSLSKFMCVSKSWHQLISSPNFVNTHLNLTANHNHRVIFSGSNKNFKSCSVPPVFYNEQSVELFDVDSPVDIPFIFAGIVGSANGLICLCYRNSGTFLWNPTISKSKKLPNLAAMGYFDCQRGFGYDELHDDYKVVFVHFYYVDGSTPSLRTVVNIYSLRNDSWRILHDQLQDTFLINSFGKFVNGKLYWVSTIGTGNGNGDRNLCITSLDLADETCGTLELPNCGKVDPNYMMGVVGSDLSLICACRLDVTTSDVWIMKHCGVNVSWTKLFTIKCARYAGLYMPCPPSRTFSIHFPQLNKREILLFLGSAIMIYDCSTRQLKRTVDVEGYKAAEIYVESLVNPLMISGQGRIIHETSQSFS